MIIEDGPLFGFTVPEDRRVWKICFLIHGAVCGQAVAGRAGARESVTMSVTRSRLRGCGPPLCDLVDTEPPATTPTL